MKKLYLTSVAFLLFIIFANAQKIKSLEYVNSGAISQNISCGVGEIFVIPEIKEETKKENESKGDFITESKLLYNDNSSGIIYPNPAKDYIYLVSDYQVSIIYIYTTEGVLVAKQKIEKEAKINVIFLPKGIYILQTDNTEFKSLTFYKE